MCGILGVFPVIPEDGTKLQSKAIQEAAIRMLTPRTLLHLNQRGKDATGLAVFSGDDTWFCLKQPVSSDKFIINDGTGKDIEGQEKHASYLATVQAWQGLYDEHGQSTRAVLGHVRKGTRGDKYNPVNNHPIIIEDKLFGVHNGTLIDKNDDKIFDAYTQRDRVGAVDSEAVFHLQHALSKDSPPSVEVLMEMHTILRGAYTTLSFDRDYPNLISFIKNQRPLEFSYLEELELLIAISDDRFLKSALMDYNSFIIASGAPLPIVSSVKTRVISEGTCGVLDLSVPFTTVYKWISPETLPKEKNKDFEETTLHTSTYAGVYGTTSTYASVSRNINLNASLTEGIIMGASSQDPPVNNPAVEEDSDLACAYAAEADEIQVEVDIDELSADEKIEGMSREESDNADLLMAGEELYNELILDDGVLKIKEVTTGEEIIDVFPGCEAPLSEFIFAGMAVTEKDEFENALQKLLKEVIKPPYKVAFSEGYREGYWGALEDTGGAGFPTEEDVELENSQELVKDLERVREENRDLRRQVATMSTKLSRATTLVANLRTLGEVSLTSLGALNFEGGEVKINKALVTKALLMSRNFNPKRIEKTLGTSEKKKRHLLKMQGSSNKLEEK